MNNVQGNNNLPPSIFPQQHPEDFVTQFPPQRGFRHPQQHLQQEDQNQQMQNNLMQLQQLQQQHQLSSLVIGNNTSSTDVATIQQPSDPSLSSYLDTREQQQQQHEQQHEQQQQQTVQQQPEQHQSDINSNSIQDYQYNTNINDINSIRISVISQELSTRNQITDGGKAVGGNKYVPYIETARKIPHQSSNNNNKYINNNTNPKPNNVEQDK